MFVVFANSVIMHRNAAVISVTCILLCLTFNYTFPLHRDFTKWHGNPYINLSRIYDKSAHHSVGKKPNKMTSSLELAIKRLKDSSQDISKNIQARFNSVKNAFTEEDLRKYEQLVIMKKNPFIDLKEIELKYSPNEKTVRQSANFDTELLLQNVMGDPSIWEALEEGPNVEITSRGLSGFAIPVTVIKASLDNQNKAKLDTITGSDENQRSNMHLINL